MTIWPPSSSSACADRPVLHDVARRPRSSNPNAARQPLDRRRRVLVARSSGRSAGSCVRSRGSRTAAARPRGGSPRRRPSGRTCAPRACGRTRGRTPPGVRSSSRTRATRRRRGSSRRSSRTSSPSRSSGVYEREQLLALQDADRARRRAPADGSVAARDPLAELAVAVRIVSERLGDLEPNASAEAAALQWSIGYAQYAASSQLSSRSRRSRRHMPAYAPSTSRWSYVSVRFMIGRIAITSEPSSSWTTHGRFTSA